MQTRSIYVTRFVMGTGVFLTMIFLEVSVMHDVMWKRLGRGGAGVVLEATPGIPPGVPSEILKEVPSRINPE